MLLDFTHDTHTGHERAQATTLPHPHARIPLPYLRARIPPPFPHALPYNTEHTPARAHILNAAHISVAVGGR